MAAELRTVLDVPDGNREIRAEDFAPWSYNLHYLSSREPWTYRHHRHEGCFELVYVFDGVLEHHLEGTWRRFSAGDLLAVGEGDYHAIRGEVFSYANLILPVDFWETFVRTLVLADPLGSPRHCGGLTVRVVPSLRREFENRLDGLFRHQQTAEGERRLRRFLGLLVFEILWMEASDEAPGFAEGAPPAWWSDLVNRVETAAGIPEDPRSLAGWAGRSREHVARSCRRYMGCSPSQWLNRLRLDRAALLLRKTNRDIADIAFDAGFGTVAHFYRLFRRRFGLPPAAYRRHHGDAP